MTPAEVIAARLKVLADEDDAILPDFDADLIVRALADAGYQIVPRGFGFGGPLSLTLPGVAEGVVLDANEIAAILHDAFGGLLPPKPDEGDEQ